MLKQTILHVQNSTCNVTFVVIITDVVQLKYLYCRMKWIIEYIMKYSFHII